MNRNRLAQQQHPLKIEKLLKAAQGTPVQPRPVATSCKRTHGVWATLGRVGALFHRHRRRRPARPIGGLGLNDVAVRQSVGGGGVFAVRRRIDQWQQSPPALHQPQLICCGKFDKNRKTPATWKKE